MISFTEQKKFYITTAIDYTNGPPHIGHAYEKIVSDVLARFHRLLGEEVFFLTGTDEHGQKVEEAAKKAGKETPVFVDELVEHFKKLCSALSISHDNFIRTTDQEHMKHCQEIFQKVHDNGDIYKGEYEGLYCKGCERYYLEKELVEGNCSIHNKPAEHVKEESYFFRMGKYQEALIEHIKKNPNFIRPAFRRNEILSRLKEPLRDLSVSRKTFKWGIPLPIDEDHVIYVWFDALLNYVTGIGYPGADYEKFWPADIHVIGKDILWFHTVIWPTMLMSAGIELPKTVFSHGFINIKGAKLSKSSGLSVDPFKLTEKFGVDAVRYFFLKEIPFGEDGDYSDEALISRINGELADDLGNLVKRVATLCKKNFDGNIPKQGELEEVDNKLILSLNQFEEIKEKMLNFEYNAALTKIWEIIKEVNKYITETEPWKASPSRRETILYNATESLRIITILIDCFIPSTAEKIRNQFGFANETYADLEFRNSTEGTVKDAEILFQKFEVPKQEEKNINLEFKVAKILEVHDHPDAEKLYVEKIDVGGEPRQIVSGLRDYYTKEELIGKHIIVITNLKYAKLRGVESQGMLLAATKHVDGKEKACHLLEAPNSKPGDHVFFEGFSNNPKKSVGSKDLNKVKMFVQGKKVEHEGKLLRSDAEVISVDAPDGYEIS